MIGNIIYSNSSFIHVISQCYYDLYVNILDGLIDKVSVLYLDEMFVYSFLYISKLYKREWFRSKHIFSVNRNGFC